jgi:leucyl aminopeptidase
MSLAPKITFVAPGSRYRRVVVVFADKDLRFGSQANALAASKIIERAAKEASFKGKPRSTLSVLAPDIEGVDRLLVVGLGTPSELSEDDWRRLGGVVFAAIARGSDATIFLERPDGKPVDAAEFCLGLSLRAYRFDKYKTETKENNGGNGNGNGAAKKPPPAIAVAVDGAAQLRRKWSARSAVAEGVNLARDLVNEPANQLGPVELADRLKALTAIGLSVDVMAEKELQRLKMGALLGVAQGASRPPRVVVMRWNGGKSGVKPLVLVGKGVVFDTGGISIKPAAGMEDMKGDMGGAAAVAGTLAALAKRKAKANVVGIVGLVENMPDANAQRPGDIVTSMSGKTIEVLNTDAEGRLVLADLIHYTQKKLNPAAMIDLATLTGAIIVALGHHYAGLFASDDDLAQGLIAAGEASGEKVWRMPLADAYDKLIDSKVADVKNIGGRDAGSITAAQFIKRFVDGVPWAHLDIAGTAMASPATDTNQSWGSGFGVQLLDRLVSAKYES